MRRISLIRFHKKKLNIFFHLNNISVHPLLKSYSLLKKIKNCAISLVSIIGFMCNMKKNKN